MSKSKESRALFRAKEQARKSSKERTSDQAIITPVSTAARGCIRRPPLALCESEPIELNLFSLDELFDRSIDPALDRVAREWARNADRGSLPICRCCDTQWHGFGDIPPAGFAVLAPNAKVGAAICSGVCEGCFYQPNLLRGCVDRYRLPLWPDIYCQIMSPAPAGVQ